MQNKLKKTYLNKKTIVGSIGTVNKKDNDIEIIHKSSLVGTVIKRNGKTYVKDVLYDNRVYELIKYDDIVKKDKKVLSNEDICYSVYPIKQFDEILSMRTKEQIIEYLIDYNLKNSTTIYWTFLDEDEKKELDKIDKENKKRYNYI